MILYVLLSGNLPFEGKTNRGVFNKIMQKRPKFKSPEWRTVSKEAKDLVKNLLWKDATSRMKSGDILEHPWIADRDSK